MAALLFDPNLRARRRDRAARLGTELFLFDRAFADCLERLPLINRRFRRALLIGAPDPSWPERLRVHADAVELVEPGPAWAAAAGAAVLQEPNWLPEVGRYDLCLTIGTLDSVDDLPTELQKIRFALRPDAPVLGAVVGGDSLPRLRSAMLAADRVMGAASPHVHPRIEAASLAPLLDACGFRMPVVDVDRVRVSYRSLLGLARDLRRMGATNILRQRSRRPLSRAALAAAEEAFAADGLPATEIFEILHFAAWTPAE